MSTNKGFTLTEVLLGIMIVGIIGVALAALTTSASRDSGQSSSKIMLRNNLSIFLRGLRQDIHDSSRVLSVQTPPDNQHNFNVLVLGKKQTIAGSAIGSETPEYITYCFLKAQLSDGIKPDGAAIGGQIKRYQQTSETVANNVDACKNNGKVVLNNVKYIDSPRFPYFSASGGSLSSILSVGLILEIPSSPVVNDAVEDVFVLPNGFGS